MSTPTDAAAPTITVVSDGSTRGRMTIAELRAAVDTSATAPEWPLPLRVSVDTEVIVVRMIPVNPRVGR